MDGSEDGGLACSSRDVENVVGAIAAEFKIIVVDITSHSITASVCGAHWALESWVKNVLSSTLWVVRLSALFSANSRITAMAT